MSYTGIKEIDDVLLDLYAEQVRIEEEANVLGKVIAKLKAEASKDLVRKQLSRLNQRHSKVASLINKLHDAGKVMGELDAQHLAGAPEPVGQGTPEIA